MSLVSNSRTYNLYTRLNELDKDGGHVKETFSCHISKVLSMKICELKIFERVKVLA